MLNIVLDNVKAVSVNALYVNIPGQARRFKSAEGKKFTDQVAHLVSTYIITNNLQDEVANLEGRRLKVTVTFTSDSWITKSKTIRKKDVDSGLKATQDSIFTTLQTFCPTLDDCQIFELTARKELGNECITYQIEVM